MEKEIWKDVVDYEGYYKVSTLGRVKSLERRVKCSNYYDKIVYGGILKIFKNHRGYICVALSRDSKMENFLVHRLVLMAFIPNPSNKLQVNHKNSIKTDNMVENLEWCTQSENMKHAYANGTKKKTYKAVIQYSLNMEFISEYISITQAHQITGLRHSGISNACNNVTNTCGGFIWKLK